MAATREAATRDGAPAADAPLEPTEPVAAAVKAGRSPAARRTRFKRQWPLETIGRADASSPSLDVALEGWVPTSPSGVPSSRSCTDSAHDDASAAHDDASTGSRPRVPSPPLPRSSTPSRLPSGATSPEPERADLHPLRSWVLTQSNLIYAGMTDQREPLVPLLRRYFDDHESNDGAGRISTAAAHAALASLGLLAAAAIDDLYGVLSSGSSAHVSPDGCRPIDRRRHTVDSPSAGAAKAAREAASHHAAHRANAAAAPRLPPADNVGAPSQPPAPGSIRRVTQLANRPATSAASSPAADSESSGAGGLPSPIVPVPPARLQARPPLTPLTAAALGRALPIAQAHAHPSPTDTMPPVRAGHVGDAPPLLIDHLRTCSQAGGADGMPPHPATPPTGTAPASALALTPLPPSPLAHETAALPVAAPLLIAQRVTPAPAMALLATPPPATPPLSTPPSDATYAARPARSDGVSFPMLLHLVQRSFEALGQPSALFGTRSVDVLAHARDHSVMPPAAKDASARRVASGSIEPLAGKDGEVHDVTLSKHLSRLLRHDALDHGVALDADGWADLADALSFVNGQGNALSYTEADVLEMVRLNDKQRFELRVGLTGGGRQQIRATRGHTMPLRRRHRRQSKSEQDLYGLEQAWLRQESATSVVEALTPVGLAPDAPMLARTLRAREERHSRAEERHSRASREHRALTAIADADADDVADACLASLKTGSRSMPNLFSPYFAE